MRQFNTRTALLFIGITISIGLALPITFFFNMNMTSLLKEREKDNVRQYQAQTLNILYRELEGISVFLRDWASKSRIYDFVDMHSPWDNAAEMEMNPIFHMKLSYMGIIANNGFTSERFFNYAERTERDDAPYSDEIRMTSRWLYKETQSAYKATVPHRDLFEILTKTQRAGLVGIGDRVYYFTAAPVLTPRNDRRSNGTLIFARMIEPDELKPVAIQGEEEADNTQTTLSVLSFKDIGVGGIGMTRYTPDGKHIVLENFIPALDNSLILLTTTAQPRTTYYKGIAMIKILSVFVFGFSCLFLLTFLGMVELWLLRPIRLLSETVSSLNYNLPFVDLPAVDLPSFCGHELDILSTAIKDLLKRVNEHRTRIEEQNTKLSIQNQMLHKLANYDTLTNLPNKNMLRAITKQAISVVKEQEEALWLMYIDITNFSLIRNACGQTTCDMLLIALANRLKSTFGIFGKCTIARIARENFAILCPAQSKKEIEVSARELQSIFEETFTVRDNEIIINASIGIAAAPFDGETFEELDACANIAMNNARRTEDRSTYFLFFDQRQLETITKRYSRIAELKKGIERGEFRVVFQPKVDIRTNLITSSEALVRWHSSSGTIPPSVFIPDACETGLIVPLSWEILRQAFECNNRFAATLGGSFSVGVNIPNNVLLHSDFISTLISLFNSTHMPPTRLNVELTEDVLVNDMEKCNDRMNELQRMGAQISVDDFGTGYASLQYLSRMPFDWIKIDKTFVDGLPNKPEAMAIISASVGIARSLGMKIVLEGVETRDQWNKIAEQNYCDQIQGYVVSKPLPEDDFIRFVTEWNAQNKRQN